MLFRRYDRPELDRATVSTLCQMYSEMALVYSNNELCDYIGIADGVRRNFLSKRWRRLNFVVIADVAKVYSEFVSHNRSLPEIDNKRISLITMAQDNIESMRKLGFKVDDIADELGVSHPIISEIRKPMSITKISRHMVQHVVDSSAYWLKKHDK